MQIIQRKLSVDNLKLDQTSVNLIFDDLLKEKILT